MNGPGAGARSHQTRSACDLCRIRKIRCDWTAPACETCQVVGVDCTFTELPTNARKTVREKLAETEARLQQLKDALRREQQVGRRCARGTSTLVPSLFKTQGWDEIMGQFRWHLSFCVPGAVFPAREKSVLSLHALCDDLCQDIKSQYPSGTGTIGAARWPSRLLVQRSIDYYRANGLYSVFPVVRWETLTGLLEAGVLDAPAESVDAASMATLAAFTAFITRIRPDEPDFVNVDSNSYAQAALTLLPELTVDHTNPRTLEALIMLALYIAPLGHPQTAEILLSMAIRTLFNLGANRRRPVGDGAREDPEHEHLRALFWHCYAIDKEMSFRKCQAPMIHDRDCDLDLPGNYVSASSDRQFFKNPLLSHELLYPSDLRLSLLKSRVYDGLYSVQSLTIPEGRRLQLIRELDHELGDLKSHFPLACQPEAFVNGSVPESLIHDLSLRGLAIHLEYYHCLAMIHGASVVGQTSVTPGEPALSSSMEICHHAARSSLLYIQQTRHHMVPETFWIYAQFILTAVLSLYWRLMTNPTNPDAGHDIQVLEDTRAIFTRLNRAPTGGGFLPFVTTEAFIRRLISRVHQSRAVH